VLRLGLVLGQGYG